MSPESFQSRERERLMLGDSAEFRRVRRAVDKAGGDRERAVRNICRLATIKRSSSCACAKLHLV